eukprot:CAMPEP_0116895546 /NCGR_PEP_ID=MMETSP0467-20121206/5049_1 /TAXON_ID=283647 /ORGANISM="Mesodinium pulex, Strain SPMC105" /LENGTH=30 /DNA_ID= /DNA_START= /DNA_END= /DNA_ORIENTATION=
MTANNPVKPTTYQKVNMAYYMKTRLNTINA